MESRGIPKETIQLAYQKANDNKAKAFIKDVEGFQDFNKMENLQISLDLHNQYQHQ